MIEKYIRQVQLAEREKPRRLLSSGSRDGARIASGKTASLSAIGETPFDKMAAGSGEGGGGAYYSTMRYLPHTSNSYIDISKAKVFEIGMSSQLQIIPLFISGAAPGTGDRILDVRLIIHPSALPAGLSYCVANIWASSGTISKSTTIPPGYYQPVVDALGNARKTTNNVDIELRPPGVSSSKPFGVSLGVAWFERTNQWYFYT